MEPLIINNWYDAIADSPHVGIGLLKNVEISAFPGAVRTGRKPSTVFTTSTSTTFTADAGTDVCTGASFTSDANTTGVAVTLSSTGTLPAGLSASTTYFVIRVVQGSGTFKLATTQANAQAGTAINITDAGTGTHTVATTNPGTINHYARDPRTGTIFCIDSNGRVWYQRGGFGTNRLLPGNTLTSSNGKGLAIFRTSDGTATYLFVFRNQSIDVVNVFGTTQLEAPSWTNGWQTMNSGAGLTNSHHAINAQDNIIYFCDDRYVGSIKELTVFDPATGGTYTYNNQALDLPQSDIANWLEELGTNLLIAGNTSNKVYPWDRVSDSFSLPLPVPENVVNKLKNIGNIVYILAGTSGVVYQTQGSYVRIFKKIPEYITNNAGSIQSNIITWGGIAQKDGGLLFGLTTQTSGNSGVYLLYPDGRLVMDNMPSTGSAIATALYAQNDLYYMGYAGGGDDFSTFARYASFESIIHSQLYRVATKTKKAKYSKIEIDIAKPVSGHARIKYRTDITASFSDFPSGAISFTTDTSNFSYDQDIGLIDVENIQIQVEMDGNVELMDVRLIP